MYRLTKNPDSVVRISDGTLIPRGHRWWVEYEAWIDAGNSPDPAPDNSEDEARGRRDSLLRECDWTQLDDSPLTAALKLSWATYRAALRSLPSRPGFPNVTWPVAPDMPAGTADQVPSGK